VDATPDADTAVDDALRTVELVVKVDEQVQYRVGSIEFLGVDSVTREKLIESLPTPGEIFDTAKLDEFFKVNRAILPSDASRDDVAVERQNKMRTVRIVFDLRVCPQPSN
jgi:outer membrane protein assembly factor BamA